MSEQSRTTTALDVPVQLREVAQGYRGRPVLDRVDLELRPGITALVGPNGAGKSTLLKTIATILPAKEGELLICGQRIRSRDSVRRARSQIGFLPQDFGADPSFTVRDFVTYVGWLRAIPKSRLSQAVNDAIAAVDLDDRSTSRFRSLSGGMRQRAGIAAAIVGKPAVVILDEPTVGLDPQQRLGFRSLLRSISDATVILSTHLIEDVAAVADRVVLLNHGDFLFDGSLEELVAHGADDASAGSALENAYIAMLGSGA